MDMVPETILHMIRQNIFNFLWFRSTLGNKIHLASWDRISRQKYVVGWDTIKNMYWFSLTLRIKNTSIGLFGIVLWHDVHHAKYLKRKSISSWIMNPRKPIHGASNLWNSLVRSFS